jgi:recombinational DNA repair protein RecT
MNHKKIKRLMKKYSLKTKVRIKNPYREMAKKTIIHTTCNNILNRNFNQKESMKVLCTDITYLHYHN